MRVAGVEVKNLFGVFNHQIPLNIEDHITIIHSPNGYGKTVLLTMVNALFNSRYGELQRIPFSEFKVYFTDTSFLRLTKGLKLDNAEDRDRDPYVPLGVEYVRPDRSFEAYTIRPLKAKDFRYPIDLIEREIPGLERISPDAWHFVPTGEKLSLQDILDRFGDRLPLRQVVSTRVDDQPSWFKEIKLSLQVRLIETQRLLSFSSPREQREYERRPPMVPSVLRYSQEIAQAIQMKLTEYAALAQSLDRTFPARLVRGGDDSGLTVEDLRRELDQLEEKRSRLITSGLLDKEGDIEFREFSGINETNRNVLSVYVRDIKRKLGVFDELTNKIDLLVKIINSRFRYKRLSISKKEGFVFTTAKGTLLPTAKLSSGEQHELVLLYELLFKVSSDSLIMIDEPELSLHVVWQQQFLNDLQEVTKLAGFDVLIATHSPQIIQNHWDWTVELKGPANEAVPEPV